MKLKQLLKILQVILITGAAVSCSEKYDEEPDDLIGPQYPRSEINVQWSTTDTVISLDSYYKNYTIVRSNCNIIQSGTYSISNGNPVENMETGWGEKIEWANCSFDEDNRELLITIQPNTGSENRYFVPTVFLTTKEGRQIYVSYTIYQPNR